MSTEVTSLSTQSIFSSHRSDAFDLGITNILIGFALAIISTIILASVSNGFTTSLGRATVLYPALYGFSGGVVAIGLIFLAIHMCDDNRSFQTNRTHENQINYDEHL